MTVPKSKDSANTRASSRGETGESSVTQHNWVLKHEACLCCKKLKDTI
jgi:hypothetical protein